MKYLVVALVTVAVLWFMFRRDEAPRARSGGKGRLPPPQPMVKCAHCGVHLPADEALKVGALHYCGPEHLRLGPARK